MAIKKNIKRRSTSTYPNIIMPPSSSSSSPSSSRAVGFKSFHILVLVVMVIGVVLLLSIFSRSWFNFWSAKQSPVSSTIFGVEVVNEFPHDSSAFTQGLLYAGNGTLFESTGLYGQSSVRKVSLKTGKVEVLQKMSRSYFGEGLTLLGKRLFQVTWLKQTGFIYDRNNLSKIEKFTHQMQDGWGLATDGKVLFGSDGTSTLYHINPKSLKVVRKDTVKYNGHEVRSLNELEFINGEVWANVWMTDCIARISPEGGNVLGWILLPQLREGLIAAGNNGIDVLNGIAWDKDEDRLYVTGKLWPKLYEIKLHPEKKLRSIDIERLCLQ